MEAITPELAEAKRTLRLPFKIMPIYIVEDMVIDEVILDHLTRQQQMILVNINHTFDDFKKNVKNPREIPNGKSVNVFGPNICNIWDELNKYEQYYLVIRYIYSSYIKNHKYKYYKQRWTHYLWMNNRSGLIQSLPKLLSLAREDYEQNKKKLVYKTVNIHDPFPNTLITYSVALDFCNYEMLCAQEAEYLGTVKTYG